MEYSNRGYDTLPVASPRRAFPGRDIRVDRREKGNVLLFKMSCGDEEEQYDSLWRMMEDQMDGWKNRDLQIDNYNAIKTLTNGWANTLAAGEDAEWAADLAWTGVISTVAFVRQSKLMPVKFHNFSKELEKMGNGSDEYIERFTNTAWLGMLHSHPQLHTVLGAFHDHLVTYYFGDDIYDTDDYLQNPYMRILRAGCALPYVMSTTSRMMSNLGSVEEASYTEWSRQFGENRPE